jgi:hypothetical protein
VGHFTKLQFEVEGIMGKIKSQEQLWFYLVIMTQSFGGQHMAC